MRARQAVQILCPASAPATTTCDGASAFVRTLAQSGASILATPRRGGSVPQPCSARCASTQQTGSRGGETMLDEHLSFNPVPPERGLKACAIAFQVALLLVATRAVAADAAGPDAQGSSSSRLTSPGDVMDAVSRPPITSAARPASASPSPRWSCSVRDSLRRQNGSKNLSTSAALSPSARLVTPTRSR